MKQIAISKLKQMSAEDIEDSECFQIVADGEPIAIVIIGAIQAMRNRIIVLASQIDAMRGK